MKSFSKKFTFHIRCIFLRMYIVFDWKFIIWFAYFDLFYTKLKKTQLNEICIFPIKNLYDFRGFV
jgi:hypothetical protein